jgi:hypothetical protein
MPNPSSMFLMPNPSSMAVMFHMYRLGERCVWLERGGGAESASLFSYSTCGPNAACGDATCDPLERLEPAICPQDCANFSGIRIYLFTVFMK